MIRVGTVDDLDDVAPLLERAFDRNGAPYLSVSVDATRRILDDGLRGGKFTLFLEGDPPVAFAWAEGLPAEFLVHQIYTSPRHSFRLLWQAVCDFARWKGYRAVTGVTYKFSVARLFRRYGVRPVAIVMRGDL